MTYQVTIDALHYALRSGFACFKDNPTNLDRLRGCDEAAIRQISADLLDLHNLSKGSRPNWSEDQVERLITVWRELKDGA
jgi:hypothetical protein